MKVRLALRVPLAAGSEGHVDRAGACRCQRAAATGAGVGLRKVARVGPGECDAADAQGRRATVGERHRLRGTGGSHVLIAKVDKCWIQTNQRSCRCACSR